MTSLELTVQHCQFAQPLIDAWHRRRGDSQVLAYLLIEPTKTLLKGILRRDLQTGLLDGLQCDSNRGEGCIRQAWVDNVLFQTQNAECLVAMRHQQQLAGSDAEGL